MLTSAQLKEALDVLHPVMIACGQELEKHRGAVESVKKANAYDLLTTFDTQVEDRLRTVLHDKYPTVPFVGEESGGDYSASEFWLVDPLDGTIHFTRGLPFSMIMVSLIQDRRPVLSALYNFATGDFFSAYKGGGASLNNAPITVSTKQSSEAVILTEMNLSVNDNIHIFQELDSRFKIIDTCSAGFEFCLVARGALEARVTKDPYGKAYDFAPGALLVSEAGGVVREVSGSEFTIDSRDFLVASSEEVFHAITTIIKGI